MRTFEQAYQFTNGVSSATAYDEGACELFWHTLEKLKPRSYILEVGCEFGRSTSLLAQAAKDCGHHLTLIDPFVSNVELNPGPRLIEMLLKVGAPFTLHCMRGQEVNLDSLPRFDLVHIDGDHEEFGITHDCTTFLPLLRSGGYAIFHDYGRDSLPHVYPVVNKFTEGWEDLGTVQTCHVVRKP